MTKFDRFGHLPRTSGHLTVVLVFDEEVDGRTVEELIYNGQAAHKLDFRTTVKSQISKRAHESEDIYDKAILACINL